MTTPEQDQPHEMQKILGLLQSPAYAEAIASNVMLQLARMIKNDLLRQQAPIAMDELLAVPALLAEGKSIGLFKRPLIANNIYRLMVIPTHTHEIGRAVFALTVYQEDPDGNYNNNRFVQLGEDEAFEVHRQLRLINANNQSNTPQMYSLIHIQEPQEGYHYFQHPELQEHPSPQASVVVDHAPYPSSVAVRPTKIS